MLCYINLLEGKKAVWGQLVLFLAQCAAHLTSATRDDRLAPPPPTHYHYATGSQLAILTV